MKQILQKTFLTALSFACLFITQDATAQCGPGETAQTFTATGAAQSWTVPIGVTSITITAVGADGGNDNVNGGAGSTAVGTFTVAGGNSISVVVGEAGSPGTGGAGGGGGSGVVNTTTSTTLVVAGGGGGASGNPATPGSIVAGAGGGGAAGIGSTQGDIGGQGAGGGGITGAGATGLRDNGGFTPTGTNAIGGTGGFSAAGGAGGAAGTTVAGAGGYGVGGGGGGNHGRYTPATHGGGGGGGGYTGGAGNPTAPASESAGGVGGSSFADASGTAVTLTPGGATAGAEADGSVVICFVIPLPVNFVSFDAFELINNHVQLDWVTVNEKSNDHFEIQHSTNGEDFTTIGKQLPVDEIDGFYTYSFTHTEANTGDNFYRIKQVDMDGEFVFTAINRVTLSPLDKTEINVFPNITAKDVTVKIDAQNNQTAQLQITAANGQTIEKKEISISAGLQQFTLNTDTWSAGLHIIQISQGATVKQFKVIKK